MIFNGSDMLLFNAATDEPIACQRNVDVSFTTELIDVTCKQSSGNAEFLPGLRSFSVTCEALVDWQPIGTDEGISELVTAYENRAKLEVYIADPTKTDIYFNGECFIESLEVNAGIEDATTYTVTLSGTGDFASFVS
jgi:TP901-1 family phage major tail protein